MAGLYLISYDITEPKRLMRLHRRLKMLATPIQYSVFLGRLTDERLGRCIAVIEATIDPRTDDVRIYPLPAAGWSRRIGRPLFPAGIVHTGLPETFDALPDEPAAAPGGRRTADETGAPGPAPRPPRPCAPAQPRAEIPAARTLRRSRRTAIATGLLLIR